MKALVTGGSGFVGPHLGAHLADMGDRVVTVDLGSGPDVRDAAAWAEKLSDERPDVVYHLAGRSDVGGSWADPVGTFDINATGTMAVLEAARRAGVSRVLVVSSAEVYGTVDCASLPVTESLPTVPESPYGASKVAVEIAAEHYWRGRGLETVVARPFNHVGPGQSTRFIVPALATQIAAVELGQGERVVHGDLSPRRDLTDVRDVVRAYRMLAENGDAGEIYNVCSGRDVAMSDVLRSLADMSDDDIVGTTDPDLVRPVELPVLVGSYDRLRAATGWEPTIDIQSTLANVLDEARRQRRLSPTA